MYNLSFPSLNWRPEILPAEFSHFHSYFNQQNFLQLFFLKFNFWIASSMHEHERQKWNFPKGAFVSNQPNNALVFWSCQTKLIDVCKGMVTRLGIKVEHPVYIKMSMRNKSGIFPRELLFQTNLANTVHRGAFCQFPFWRIYYYGSKKSTKIEIGTTQIWDVWCQS